MQRPTWTYARSLQILLIDYPDGTEYRARGTEAADQAAELAHATPDELARLFEQFHELAEMEATR